MLNIKEVKTDKELKKFIMFPFKLAVGSTLDTRFVNLLIRELFFAKILMK